MKKYRVITKAGEKVIKAMHVKYEDMLVQFFNEAKEIVATFNMDHVIGVIDEV